MKKYVILFFAIMFLLTIACKNENSTIVNSKEVKQQQADPLLFWNDVASKKNTINYIDEVTNKESENFIPIKDRIATFDNDGNLWAEQPAYFQLFFAIDRVKAMAADHPEWKDE